MTFSLWDSTMWQMPKKKGPSQDSSWNGCLLCMTCCWYSFILLGAWALVSWRSTDRNRFKAWHGFRHDIAALNLFLSVDLHDASAQAPNDMKEYQQHVIHRVGWLPVIKSPKIIQPVPISLSHFVNTWEGTAIIPTEYKSSNSDSQHVPRWW